MLGQQVAARPASIGVLDSGIGGLSVLRQLHQLLPHHSTLYLADQVHLPYGPRAEAEIITFVDGIIRFLLDEGARVIVIACNTASAAALHQARATFPDIPIVGMEPALKPAVAATRSGVVAVLSTQATAAGAPYQRLLDQYGQQVKVITCVAPQLVQIAEAQTQHTTEGRAAIQAVIEPLLQAGVDEIVLGCTHFPFLMDAVQPIAGAGVHLIDPSPAVARQTARVWPAAEALPLPVQHRYFTTGSPQQLQMHLGHLLGIAAVPDALHWDAAGALSR